MHSSIDVKFPCVVSWRTNVMLHDRSVSTILLGFQSFMLDNDPTLGSVSASERQRCDLAASSLAYNMRDKDFVELFPHHAEKFHAGGGVGEGGGSSSGAAGSTGGAVGGHATATAEPSMLLASVVIAVVVLAVAIKLVY